MLGRSVGPEGSADRDSGKAEAQATINTERTRLVAVRKHSPVRFKKPPRRVAVGASPGGYPAIPVRNPAGTAS